MVKIFWKNISLKILIIVFISLLLLPMMVIKTTSDINLLSVSLSSNYITLVLNQIYILVMFKRVKTINSVYDKIVCRIGTKEFFKKYILLIATNILLYFAVLYTIVYVLVGLPMIYIIPFLIFLIINFASFMIQELICLIMIENNQNKYIWLPIIINLFFHYVIANIFISFFI